MLLLTEKRGIRCTDDISSGKEGKSHRTTQTRFIFNFFLFFNLNSCRGALGRCYDCRRGFWMYQQVESHSWKVIMWSCFRYLNCGHFSVPADPVFTPLLTHYSQSLFTTNYQLPFRQPESHPPAPSWSLSSFNWNFIIPTWNHESIMEYRSCIPVLPGTSLITSVADSDPVGSGPVQIFRIRFRIRIRP